MKQTSELPIYEVASDLSDEGIIDFGPGSSLIGCIAYDYTITDGNKILIIFAAPENRVNKIANWSYAMEHIWKKQIKKIMEKFLDNGCYNIFLHWDPPIAGDHQFEQKYRCEYFEKLSTDESLAFLEGCSEGEIFHA